MTELEEGHTATVTLLAFLRPITLSGGDRRGKDSRGAGSGLCHLSPRGSVLVSDHQVAPAARRGGVPRPCGATRADRERRAG